MKKKVVVLGDAILDSYKYGIIERTSYEAPTPIFLIKNIIYELGGVFKAAEILDFLGEETYFIGVTGKDSYSEKLEMLLNENNFKTIMIKRENKITNVKNRYIVKGYFQQVFRVDYEDGIYICKEDENFILNKINEINPDYIVICDYTLGAITLKLVNSLKKKFKIYAHVKPKNIVFYKDIELIKPIFLDLKDIINLKKQDSTNKALQELTELFNSKFLINENLNFIYADKEKNIFNSNLNCKNNFLGIEEYLLGTFAFNENNNYNKKELMEKIIRDIKQFLEKRKKDLC